MTSIAILADKCLTMSSREIAELTGKDVAHVHRDIRAMLDQLGDDPELEHVKEDKDARGYTSCFHLTKGLSMTLVAGYNVKLRKAIIDRWQELEASKAPAIPKTFAQALRLAAEQQERIEAQQVKIEADRPKVAYADALLNSDGTTLVRDVAKTLGVGPIKLHKALKEKGVILENNAPAAEYVHKGYFVESIHTYKTATAGDRIAHAARVTGKGIEFIRRFIARHGDLLAQRTNRGVMQ